MKLRKLDLRDAPLMLEWMHDPCVVQHMKADFLSKTIEDCESFIVQSRNSSDSLHLAITDDLDMYMGTVSLKHILDNSAEFGITVRSSAMGKGFSVCGMEKIFQIGFEALRLNLIYWCVDPLNKRALQFYEKHGFLPSSCPEQAQGYSDEEKLRYTWFSVTASEWKHGRQISRAKGALS